MFIRWSSASFMGTKFHDMPSYHTFGAKKR